jgi:hypothetical protein
MDEIVDLLRSEVARLEAELADLANERLRQVATLDARLEEVRQRLTAADRMLKVYRNGKPAPAPSSAPDPTWPEVNATTIPTVLRGHPMRADAKRTKIIKAAKAFLQAHGTATRSELVDYMKRLGLMGAEKDPRAYLSVTLWQAREILDSNGSRWRLRPEGIED